MSVPTHTNVKVGDVGFDACRKSWKITVMKDVSSGTVAHHATASKGKVFYVCGVFPMDWVVVSDKKDGSSPLLFPGVFGACETPLLNDNQWNVLDFATFDWSKSVDRDAAPKSTSGASGSSPKLPPRVQENVLDASKTHKVGAGKSVASGFAAKTGEVLAVLAFLGADDVVASDGKTVEWMKTAAFELPTGVPGPQVVFPLTKYIPGATINQVLPDLKACLALLNAAGDDKDGLGFFGGLGAWVWCGIEGVGLFAYGINRLTQDTVTMPLLRMFREPERWEYKVKLRKLDQGATAPTAPTDQDDGEAAAGFVEEGGFRSSMAASGGALAGVSYSTLAFFTWPFRKWAGDEYVDEVDATTGDRVAEGTRGVWLTPKYDVKDGKFIERVGYGLDGTQVKINKKMEPKV